MIIHTDRSRMECYEKCPAKRFYLYEYDGKGLESTNDLKLDARIGTWTHNGVEGGLTDMVAFPDNQFQASDIKHIAENVGMSFVEDCTKVLGEGMEVSEQLGHDISEGGQIVTALVYAWLRLRAPRLLADGEVIAIEKEMHRDFPVGSDVVRFMARPDILWRRKSDRTIFIRNLKTVRDPDKMGWRDKWPLDMQTLSEPLVVDQWLSGEACGGVIIDGLVTGRMTKSKETGLYHHDNPLVYAWFQSETDAYYPRYEWRCDSPHKFGNGRKCDGGRAHKLSGGTRVPVAERYAGGITAWVDYLIEHDISVVEEMLIELPPIIRSEYQINRWQAQVLGREVFIHGAAQNVGFVSIDAAFPMHTANGNCLMPGRCECMDLCHGVAASDPLNAGYKYRVPNHPQEVDGEG